VSHAAGNGWLLVIVAVLGLAVWLTPPQTRDTTAPLTSMQASQVTQITLSNRNGSNLRMIRRGDGWWMLSPYQTAANQGRIQLLLNILATPSHESFAVPDSGLEPFGLAPPAAQLTLDDLTIEMGGTHPYNHDRYLRIGDRIHLIKDIFPHHLMAAAEDYVSPRLLPEGAVIRAIETQDWRIQRERRGDWTLTPGAPGLSQDELVARVQSWQHAQALKVIEAPAGSPDGTVAVDLQGMEQPIRFELLRMEHGAVLIRRDLGLAWRLAPTSNLLAPPAPAATKGEPGA